MKKLLPFMRWTIVVAMVGSAVLAIASRDWALVGASIAGATGWWHVITSERQIAEIWKLALPAAHKRY